MEQAAIPVVDRQATMYEVDLTPVRVLGNSVTEPLKKRMTMGEPLLAPLSSPTHDNEAVRDLLVRAQADFDFYELHLVLTLHPDDDRPFLDVALGVSLASAAGSDRPIAWSLHPLRAETSRKETSSLALSTNLGFVEPEVTRSREQEVSEYFVVGLGERESEFEWRFSRTTKAQLVGVQRMYAVIRAAKSVPFEASVTVAATVRTPKKLGIPMRAPLPDPLRRVISS